MKGRGIYEFHRRKAEAPAQRGEEVQPVENQPPDLMEIYRRARQGYDSGQNSR
jgi:hypothetical protein